jgi:hypothetical protein
MACHAEAHHNEASSRASPFVVQAMAASWDSLCPEMRGHVFAALSLLDLGRAAPTCRDFRAAYTARLSAAHPAAVEAGVSRYGAAFLRTHGIVILRLLRGVDLFSGGSRREGVVRILHDGTLRLGYPSYWGIARHGTVIVQDSYRPVPIPLVQEHFNVRDRWSHPERYGGWPWQFYAGPASDCEGPSLSYTCYLAGEYLCIDMSCGIAQCREAAGALVAICKHVQAVSRLSARISQGPDVKLAVQVIIGSSTSLQHHVDLSEARLDGIAAAFLPLSKVIHVLRFCCPLLRHGLLRNCSLGKLQTILREI